MDGVISFANIQFIKLCVAMSRKRARKTSQVLPLDEQPTTPITQPSSEQVEAVLTAFELLRYLLSSVLLSHCAIFYKRLVCNDAHVHALGRPFCGGKARRGWPLVRTAW